MELALGIIVLTWSAYYVCKLASRALFCFRPQTLSAYFLPYGATAPVGQTEAFRQVDLPLRELRFEPLGVLVERCPWFGPRIQSYTYASKEHSCFASIFAVRRRLFYYFFTPLTEGGIVLTANRWPKFVQLENYRVSCVETKNPADVLAKHRLEVTDLEANGYRALEDYNRETQILALRQFYNTPGTIQSLRKKGLVLVALLGMFVIAVTVAILTS